MDGCISGTKMNIPLVFINSVKPGEVPLQQRWWLAHALNQEGLLTDFNRSYFPTMEVPHSRTPFTLIIDAYDDIYLTHNYKNSRECMPIAMEHIAPYLHDFVLSCAPGRECCHNAATHIGTSILQGSANESHPCRGCAHRF